MLLIACPGQGAQTPGFLRPWLEDKASESWLSEASDLIGIDLIEHGTVSDAETIKETRIAQPLIVAAGILTISALQSKLEEAGDAAGRLGERLAYAGHSVGEITAAYGAGVFDKNTALRFVSARAEAMQKCAEASATGMCAVLGGKQEEVEQALTDAGLSPANYNGGGQIVAAGPVDNLQRFQESAPRGVRVIPLSVAGAFHTSAMQDAREELETTVSEYAVDDPTSVLYSNADGARVTSGNEFLNSLVSQISSPVRWDLEMEHFLADGISEQFEVTPANALTGLAKRGMRGVPSSKVNTPDDVSLLVERLMSEAQHG